MSIDDTDVLARLRAGADTVEERQFDPDAVLTGSRRALRRRRSWQAVGACTTAAIVTFSLALAGPLPVPGVGDVALPGSEQMRELFGIAVANEANESGCAVPEPAVRRTPDPGAPTHLRPRVTYYLTDARPMSDCYDVRIDDTLPAAPDLTPETVTEDGAFWRASQTGSGDGYFIGYQVFGTQEWSGESTGDQNTVISGLTAHGRRAAWYEISGETPDELVNTPYTLRTTTTRSGDTRTIAEVPRGDSASPVMTDERIAWRHGDTVSVAPADGSGQPRTLADQAVAVGSDDDEVVVATHGQDADGYPTTSFTSYGDDGSVTPLLTVNSPTDGTITDVDLTDDVLTYVYTSDYVGLTVVPRSDGVIEPDTDQTVVVQLAGNSVDSLFAAGDAVAWVSSIQTSNTRATGQVAYLLRDTAPSRAGGPDLVRVGQSGPRERMLIGLAGDRIAWNTAGGSASEVMVNVGTLVGRGQPNTSASTAPNSPGRAVLDPAAPAVTVPQNAKFPTYD